MPFLSYFTSFKRANAGVTKIKLRQSSPLKRKRIPLFAKKLIQN